MTKAQILKRYWKLLDLQRQQPLTDDEQDDLRFHADLVTLYNTKAAK
jgi:hypothetical protein